MNPAQIVLIEDNPADVLLVEKALRENGIEHSLTQFNSGAEAIRALCAPYPHQPDFMPDVILLDLNTPRTDGFEALHRLMEFPRFAGVPIAILTSSRDRRDKHRAALQGARYIEKPSQLGEFLTSVGGTVREMLGSRRAPGVTRAAG